MSVVTLFLYSSAFGPGHLSVLSDSVLTVFFTSLTEFEIAIGVTSVNEIFKESTGLSSLISFFFEHPSF